MNMVNHAYWLARTMHTGQFRRDGKTPYFNHVHNVAQRVKKFGADYEIVAYLHDTIEDTKITAQDLLNEGFDEHIVSAVQLLTKVKNQNYEDYLKQIKQNELARQVKIADMLSNLSDDPTDKQIRKYAKGLLILVDDEG